MLQGSWMIGAARPPLLLLLLMLLRNPRETNKETGVRTGGQEESSRDGDRWVRRIRRVAPVSVRRR